MVCLLLSILFVDNDGFLDYVQVLHQFSFAVLNQQMASRVNLKLMILQCHSAKTQAKTLQSIFTRAKRVSQVSTAHAVHVSL